MRNGRPVELRRRQCLVSAISRKLFFLNFYLSLYVRSKWKQISLESLSSIITVGDVGIWNKARRSRKHDVTGRSITIFTFWWWQKHTYTHAKSTNYNGKASAAEIKSNVAWHRKWITTLTAMTPFVPFISWLFVNWNKNNKCNQQQNKRRRMSMNEEAFSLCSVHCAAYFLW